MVTSYKRESACLSEKKKQQLGTMTRNMRASGTIEAVTAELILTKRSTVVVV